MGNVAFETRVERLRPLWHFLFALLFFGGILIEFGTGSPNGIRAGAALQLLALLCEVGWTWKLYRKHTSGVRTKILVAASWCLPLASLGVALLPEWSVHLYHIAYVGCFMTGTIAVASHVLVSHMGLNTELMQNFRPLGAVVVTLLIAGATRVLAPLVSYQRHLGYAGLLASASLVYWGYRFVLRRT
jgi:hypothetical protein